MIEVKSGRGLLRQLQLIMLTMSVLLVTACHQKSKPTQGTVSSENSGVTEREQRGAVSEQCDVEEVVGFFKGFYFTVLTNPDTDLPFVDFVYDFILRLPGFAKPRVEQFLRHRLKKLERLQPTGVQYAKEREALGVWLSAIDSDSGQESKSPLAPREESIDLSEIEDQEQLRQLQQLAAQAREESCTEGLER